MARNGISTLETKEDRLIAKLELAQTKRQQTGTQGYRDLRYYDLSLLPTQYSGNTLVNNPNVGGLVRGRPWKTTPNITLGLWRTVYNGYFDGDYTWFDTQTPASEGEVNNFSVDDVMDTNISVQWLGYFRAPHTAMYTFSLDSDDISYFWLGDKAITNYNDANSDVSSEAGSGEFLTEPIALEAGQYYPIRVQYGNGVGSGYMILSWEDDYVGPFPTFELVDPTGGTINTEQVAAFKLNIQSSSFQVEPHVNGQISINDTLTVDTSTRGHTVLAMNPDGSVIEQVTYDTYGSLADQSNMNNSLILYPIGTVVAICSYDACGLGVSIRNALTTHYGATLTDTWDPTRFSHIFIGQKQA